MSGPTKKAARPQQKEFETFIYELAIKLVSFTPVPAEILTTKGCLLGQNFS